MKVLLYECMFVINFYYEYDGKLIIFEELVFFLEWLVNVMVKKVLV